MGFAVVCDSLTKEILEIEELPIQSDFDTVDRTGDQVPEEEANYDPTVSGRWYRDDISRIDISQENGPSFTVDGNVLEWQKFKMRLG
jgi:primary-amine oxidase